MEFWVNVWTFVLVAGLLMFGILAVFVAFGGASDIRNLLKSIDQGHQSQDSPADAEKTGAPGSPK